MDGTDDFEVITEEYEGINEQQADESFRRLLKRGVPEFLDSMQLSVSEMNVHSPTRTSLLSPLLLHHYMHHLIIFPCIDLYADDAVMYS